MGQSRPLARIKMNHNGKYANWSSSGYCRVMASDDIHILGTNALYSFLLWLSPMSLILGLEDEEWGWEDNFNKI